MADVPTICKEPNLARYAYHEAGHVVLFEWAGIAVAGGTATECGGVVYIDPERLETDISNDGDLGDYDRPLAAAHLAACCHAGIMAELLYTGRPWDGIIIGMQSQDWKIASLILAPHFGAGLVGHGFAQRTALAVLSEHWPRVEEIADHFIKCGAWSPQ
nr:hypothetical protein [Zoogloeaceae bacterium]